MDIRFEVCIAAAIYRKVSTVCVPFAQAFGIGCALYRDEMQSYKVYAH